MIGTSIDPRIVTTAPSGDYGFFLATTVEDGPVVAVALSRQDLGWSALGPAWLASEVAALALGTEIALDAVGDFTLDVTDTDAFREFARTEVWMHQLLAA